MKTFHTIAQNITKARQIFIDTAHTHTPEPEHSYSIVHNYFLLLIDLGDTLTPSTKFRFFSQGLQCFFIIGENQPLFIHLFYQIQKTYHVLNRFIRRIKYNKAIINVRIDFYLNPLDEHSKYVFCFFDGKVKYLFHVNDLRKIIMKALTNSDHFYECPMPIKNPYTNLPFSKSALYSIYFFMRFSRNMECPLFYLFFKWNFNISDFLYHCEHELREHIIDNYVKNANKEQILDMIDFYNKDVRVSKKHIKINEDFPENMLVPIFTPYFKLFVQSNYSLIRHVRNRSYHEFFAKMEEFQEFNPRFGEKSYKIVSVHNPTATAAFSNKIYRERVFNSTHVPFYENDTTYFLSDHVI